MERLLMTENRKPIKKVSILFFHMKLIVFIVK